MSGFIGIIAPQLQKADAELLDVSTQAIASCCNEYLGNWNSHQADLRFGWLKTSEDTEAEQLPFTLDENLRIVGDVRLDNRTELLKELSSFFSTINHLTPDSYLLLYAYKHWGENCLQHISGDYAFAIWNENSSYLFCARDHFGLIPFYYTQLDHRFLFTNFYSSLKDIPNLMIELDDDVLRDYFVTGVNKSFDQTIYKKIRKLPPAHKLIYKDGEIQVSRYWKIPTNIKPIRYKTTKEYVSHFYRLFEQSIKDRTRTNKVGSSLSGGMDSSAITATTKKILNETYGNDHTLISFNITYNRLVNENEGYFGKLIAQHLKIPIKQYFAEDYIKNIAEPLTSWIPEPAVVQNATPESQILVDVQTFSSVYLTGFGGDPLFGYEPGSRCRLRAQGYLVQPYMDDLKFYQTFGRFPGTTLRHKIMKLIKKAPAEKVIRPSWLDPSFFPEEDIPLKVNKDGTSIYSCFAMTGNPYWSYLFETTHPGFSGNKIKVRQPFFSLDLLLFILAIPPHILHQKSLLRMAMIPYLPEEIVRRQKTLLFGAPHTQNLKTQKALGLLEKTILASPNFLANKINSTILLAEIRDPNQLSNSFSNMINLLKVLSWNRYQSKN
ncbi:asparagine synthase (glutamine-hydrolysing) [Pedobacter sp. ok626]|uniref:asparagine synthetase B family protein n=1 Tax=Pedobacter sp. ok626 TaxID=1761882 RepID=UPI0008864A47|nr:asparagine synthase-related protein [Pedobacter sp. ok626]SDJ33346.1 asparagine synthase (glutamine-hydrolysing) [Pedobacter sp. ok626]